jgi:hypothetical protein
MENKSCTGFMSAGLAGHYLEFAFHLSYRLRAKKILYLFRFPVKHFVASWIAAANKSA